jgi:hypothetical protein
VPYFLYILGSPVGKCPFQLFFLLFFVFLSSQLRKLRQFGLFLLCEHAQRTMQDFFPVLRGEEQLAELAYAAVAPKRALHAHCLLML